MNAPPYSQASRASLTAAPDSIDDRDSIEAILLGYARAEYPIEVARVRQQFAFRLASPAEKGIQLGRALLVFKKECGHGNFGRRCEAIGIKPKYLSSLMQCARRFSTGGPAIKLLEAIRNSWRLFELLPLDDEQIRELELTGRTGALSVEGIAGMRRAQLRAAVRKERAARPELLAEVDDGSVRADEHLTQTLAAQVCAAIEADALKPGDRVMYRSSRPSVGTVQAVYPCGSVSVLWDGWEMFGAGDEVHGAALLHRLDTGCAMNAPAQPNGAPLRIAGLNPAAPVIGELAARDVREAEAPAASRLQAGDRIISRDALRAGTVVKVYPDGSACVVWDDGEPPPDGMGHERMPRALLVLAPNVPATLARLKAYAQALSKTLLRYADDREVDDVVDELEALVRQISERRAAPGLVAARYDLFRKFWLQGGAV